MISKLLDFYSEPSVIEFTRNSDELVRQAVTKISASYSFLNDIIDESEKKEAELPFSLAKYSDLYPGRKNEIVIFSETAGVLVYNSENQILEHVITDFPCSSQDMIGYGMLADGRFVCVYEENEEIYFSYIPIYEEEN